MESLKIKDNKAFTLIELSIVLGVISFLLAAILTTKNIIYKAKIESINIDIKKISNAVEKFEIKYGALPGDLSNISIIPSGTPSPVAGDGNGLVDTTSEALQFWYHLKLTSLLNNNFSGSSSSGYIPATYSTLGGIFAGTLDNSGFSVVPKTSLINNNSNIGKIILNFSSFPSSNYTTSILSPSDALYLDNKFDDGNPLTGLIRAGDGSDVSSGSCVSSGNYNTSTSTTACYMQFILLGYSQSTNLTSAVCANGGFGSNTIATPCPDGYRGFYTQTCNNNGALNVNEYFCEAIKCANNKSYGDSINIPCPNDQNGNILLSCSKGGVFTPTSRACTLTSNSSCTGLDSPNFFGTNYFLNSGILAKKYSCNGSNLTTPTYTEIQCGTSNIGTVRAATITTCPSNYTYNNNNGTGNEVCIIPLSGTNGNYRIIKSNCVPNFGSCTTIGSTRVLGCPASMTGAYTQICNNEQYWETYKNTCSSVKCGTEPIGSIRVALGKQNTCPINSTSYGAGGKGLMLEVCDYNPIEITNGTYSAASWQYSTINCQTYY